MNDASGQPVIIEVALNGGKTREAQPHVPLTPGEVARDGIACIDAGATIVHNHTGDPVVGGSGAHDPAPYEEAWRAILAERPNAILYPTTAGGGAHTNVEERYGHVHALAATGVLGMGLVDPGTRNVGGLDANGLPRAVNLTYQNTFADARYMFDACRDLSVGVSISIFEPGFLRVVLAYHRAGALPPGVMVKLYFRLRRVLVRAAADGPEPRGLPRNARGHRSSVARVGARRWRRGRLRSRARSVRARWTRPGSGSSPSVARAPRPTSS